MQPRNIAEARIRQKRVDVFDGPVIRSARPPVTRNPPRCWSCLNAARLTCVNCLTDEVAPRKALLHQLTSQRSLVEPSFVTALQDHERLVRQATPDRVSQDRVRMLRSERNKLHDLVMQAREVVAFHKQHLQQQSERLATAYETLRATQASVPSKLRAHIASVSVELTRNWDAMASQRKVLVDVLMKCIPIRTVSESVCSIAGVRLPNAPTYLDPEEYRLLGEEVVPSALGYAVLVLSFLSTYMRVPLPFPVQFLGSRSVVRMSAHSQFTAGTGGTQSSSAAAGGAGAGGPYASSSAAGAASRSSGSGSHNNTPFANYRTSNRPPIAVQRRHSEFGLPDPVTAGVRLGPRPPAAPRAGSVASPPPNAGHVHAHGPSARHSPAHPQLESDPAARGAGSPRAPVSVWTSPHAAVSGVYPAVRSPVGLPSATAVTTAAGGGSLSARSPVAGAGVTYPSYASPRLHGDARPGHAESGPHVGVGTVAPSAVGSATGMPATATGYRQTQYDSDGSNEDDEEDASLSRVSGTAAGASVSSAVTASGSGGNLHERLRTAGQKNIISSHRPHPATSIADVHADRPKLPMAYVPLDSPRRSPGTGTADLLTSSEADVSGAAAAAAGGDGGDVRYATMPPLCLWTDGYDSGTPSSADKFEQAVAMLDYDIQFLAAQVGVSRGPGGLIPLHILPNLQALMQALELRKHVTATRGDTFKEVRDGTSAGTGVGTAAIPQPLSSSQSEAGMGGGRIGAAVAVAADRDSVPGRSVPLPLSDIDEVDSSAGYATGQDSITATAAVMNEPVFPTSDWTDGTDAPYTESDLGPEDDTFDLTSPAMRAASRQLAPPQGPSPQQAQRRYSADHHSGHRVVAPDSQGGRRGSHSGGGSDADDAPYYSSPGTSSSARHMPRRASAVEVRDSGGAGAMVRSGSQSSMSGGGFGQRVVLPGGVPLPQHPASKRVIDDDDDYDMIEHPAGMAPNQRPGITDRLSRMQFFARK